MKSDVNSYKVSRIVAVKSFIILFIVYNSIIIQRLKNNNIHSQIFPANYFLT